MNTEPRTWNPGDSLILPPADNDNGDHQLDLHQPHVEPCDRADCRHTRRLLAQSCVNQRGAEMIGTVTKHWPDLDWSFLLADAS